MRKPTEECGLTAGTMVQPRQPFGVAATAGAVPLLLSLALAFACAGCGDVKGVTGGTRGSLRCGREQLSEIQVNVYRVEGSALRLEGFGVTNVDGEFELVANGARGPLQLVPGEYRFTLETAGAPIAFPTPYSSAESTPLAVTWSAGDEELELESEAAIPVQ